MASRLAEACNVATERSMRRFRVSRWADTLYSVISMSVVAKINTPVRSVNFITSERMTRATALRMGAILTPERAPVRSRNRHQTPDEYRYSPVLSDKHLSNHLNCG